MNADWHPTHFSDMVVNLEDTKLIFVGSARLPDGVTVFHLAEEGRKLISQIRHPIMRETVRDCLVNRRLRCDVRDRSSLKLHWKHLCDHGGRLFAFKNMSCHKSG